MKDWICKIFGHRADNPGWWGDELYGKLHPAGIDGIGRRHFKVTLRCARCNNKMVAARFVE